MCDLCDVESVVNDFSDVFCENSKARSSRARTLILKFQLKEYRCSICKVSDWNGFPLKLQMHHINGNRFDHRLKNLEFLCPNCHSQTDNFCNQKSGDCRKPMVSDAEVLAALNKTSIMREVIEFLGYSDKNPNIRKRIKKIANDNGIEVISYWKPKKVDRFCECGKTLTSKQATFCSRECKKKYSQTVVRPSKEDLIELLKTNSMVSVGKMFGVSDNAVRKWLR